ncbi:MAG: glycosyltransferase family 2 protein [Halarsenatibacteraceae bacterium]
MNICVLIPAFNEEKTVSHVVTITKSLPEIKRVIVINDGSEDNTSKAARMAGAEVIDFKKNSGKGAALKAGFDECNAEIVIMLDADLIGLKKEHIYSLLNPIIDNEYDMTVGVFNEGRNLTDLAQKVSPHLSGQRALKGEILNKIKNLDSTGYGVEVAINRYVRKHGQIKKVRLPDLTHVMKEEKRGFWKGFKSRIKMYMEVIKTLLLFFKE